MNLSRRILPNRQILITLIQHQLASVISLAGGDGPALFEVGVGGGGGDDGVEDFVDLEVGVDRAVFAGGSDVPVSEECSKRVRGRSLQSPRAL